MSADTRGPTLMQVISHIIVMHRSNHMVPTYIVVNKEVNEVLSSYVSVGTSLDRLFGVNIVLNESPTALPFVVALEDGPHE
jgi:hypothetical protein